MPTPRSRLTSFEHVLLGMIFIHPSTGYDLKRRFATTSMGVYQPSSGALYPALRALEGVADADPIYRLVTTILDPELASAEEFAALYHERWEIETALDELKTHLRGSKIVLRSKTPDLVRQEFYGLMMTHFAIRGLMHEAALQAQEDPDRLSFLHAVRVVRRKLPQFVAIPPSGEKSVS